MTTEKPPLFRGRYGFGPYVLDAHRRLLWRGDVRVPLSPKTVEVLCVLVAGRGTLVEKAVLMKTVWPDTFVEENNLARHVSTLRKALSDRKGEREYISTVPGHGYMFVSAVSELPDSDERPEADSHGPSGAVTSDPLATEPETGHPIAPAVVEGQAGAEDRSPGLPAIRGLRWTAALAATAAAAAVVAVVIARWPDVSVRIEPRLTQVTFDGGVQRDPAWSPDGRTIVYASDRAGNLDLYFVTAANSPPVRVTSNAADESQPDWSPDGTSLAFRSEQDGGGIFVMPAAGGEPRRIASFGYYPRWSPDGSRILFREALVGMGSRAFVVRSGGTDAPVAVRPELVSRFHRASFAWHPDGARVSVAGGHIDAGWAFVTVAVEGSASVESALAPDVRRQLSDRSTRLGEFTWSRTRRELYFEGRENDAQSIWRVSVNPDTLAWTSAPERVSSGPGQYADLDLAADGTRLAFTARSERTRVWRFPFDPATGRLTGPGEPLSAGGTAEYDVSAPLDGNKVAYRTVRGNRQELWERSVLDGTERLLASGSEWTRTTPRWSRDGTRLAYMRSDTRPAPSGVSRAVAILPVAGGSEQLLSLPSQMEIVPDDWSADGAWILAACRRAPRQERGTCLVPTTVGRSAGDIRVVAFDPSKSQICQRFSPDERWISFMAVDLERPSVSTIYVMPASGGSSTAITDGRFYDDKPRWSPDGTAVYFFSVRDGSANVWGRRFDPARGQAIGEPFRVTSLTTPQETLPRELGRAELAVSRNSLFVPVTETTATVWMLEGIARR